VSSPLTPRVEAWRASGEMGSFRGHAIFTRTFEGPEGPVLVFLHGYPSSSYDFRDVLPGLEGLIEGPEGRAALLFDFLGFGLSDKPPDHTYSLFWQADLVEDLIRRRFPGRDVFVVAHDMGTSVATELLARAVEGRLPFPLAGMLLFNGSIILTRASLTPAQKLLRSRIGPLAARLSNERVFRRQFGALFTEAHPLSDEEAADQWALICHNGGRTMGHATIYYLGERTRFADRWHGAIRDWDGSLSLAWGMEDPVATTSVLDGVRELRPQAPVDELHGLGHYPQVEDPARVAEAIAAAIARAAGA
jgi:pimeloyl-ACP methyl ester carboxylesterase